MCISLSGIKGQLGVIWGHRNQKVIFAKMLYNSSISTLVLRRGWLQPPACVIFFFLATNNFLSTVATRRLPNGYMLSILPYNASFHKYASKFGVVVWVGGSSKSLVEGGVDSHLPITKLFDKILVYACNLVCGLELAFSYLFWEKFSENRLFLRFLAKNRFFPILFVYCQWLEILRTCLNYDVIVTLYEDGWYFLVSMERRDPELYICSKYKGIGP